MKLFLAFLCVLSVSCGRSEKIVQTDGAVISGQSVPSNDLNAKSVVSLYYLDRRTLCTGVIIDKDIIVTAAHCGYNRHGDRDEVPTICFSQNAGESLALEAIESCVQADKTIHHENYFDGFQTNEADIADIRLISFTQYPARSYIPAALPPAKNPPKIGNQFLVYGFGLTQAIPEKSATHLQTGQINLGLAFGKTELYFPTTNNGTSACHGDSGGPIFRPSLAGPQLVGITSRALTEDGAQTCSTGFIATDVRPYLKWIKKTSADLRVRKFNYPNSLVRPTKAMTPGRENTSRATL